MTVSPFAPSPAAPPDLSYPALVGTLRTAGCVFAEDEARLLLATARTPGELSGMVERRVAGLLLVLAQPNLSDVRTNLRL